MEKKRICMAPFSEVEIDELGNINCCCMQYTNNYSFGNIFKEGFDAVWNGERAKHFRRDVIAGKYTYCNTEICNFGRLKPRKSRPPLTAPYPKYVTIAYDNTCNLMCTTCRDKIIRKCDFTEEELDKNIEQYYMPICKDAEELVLNPIGECLVSKHSRKLIQKVAEKYPDINFNIMTNGVACNEIVLKNLGLINKLSAVQVSIHAAKKETYNKITRTGNFDCVMKNLKYLSEEKKKGNIPCVIMNFVVHSLNYREMPAFVELAKNLDLEVSFWEFQNWHSCAMSENYEKYTVWDCNHPEYADFLQILKNPIFDYEQCVLNTLFSDMRKKLLSEL